MASPSPQAIAHHVTMRLQGGRVICRTASSRRRAARALYERGEGRGLLVFNVADTHIHAVLACSREEAGIFARAVESALHWRLDPRPPPFEAARFTAIETQSHLARAFWYVLRQEAHHRIAADPFHDGSSLLDLLGARLLLAAGSRVEVPLRGADRRADRGADRGAKQGVPRIATRALGAETAQRVRALLPRVTRAELIAVLGLHEEAAPHFEALPEAIAAALGLPDHVTRGHAVTIGRCAAAHLARETLPPRALASLLGISTRAVHALRAEPPLACAVRAVALQLRLRGPITTAIELVSGALRAPTLAFATTHE